MVCSACESATSNSAGYQLRERRHDGSFVRSRRPSDAVSTATIRTEYSAPAIRGFARHPSIPDDSRYRVQPARQLGRSEELLRSAARKGASPTSATGKLKIGLETIWLDALTVAYFLTATVSCWSCTTITSIALVPGLTSACSCPGVSFGNHIALPARRSYVSNTLPSLSVT